jgi:GT2 family glycosyltransferase
LIAMHLPLQIILYNSQQKLHGLLKSVKLLAEESRPEFKFHFVQHDTQDRDRYLEVILQYLTEDEFTFLQNDNVGFGAGHNFLFKQYQDKYPTQFMILNPDMIFFYDFFINLEKRLAATTDNWGLIDFAQFPHEHPKEFDPVTFHTPWVSGSATLVRKNAFAKVNGFDDNIFMYGEDVDLSWRILYQDFQLLHFPDCRVAHYINASSKDDSSNEEESPFAVQHMQAAELYLSEKFKLNNHDGIKWILEQSPYRNEINAIYHKMISRGVPYHPDSADISIASLRSKRW